MKRRRLGSRMKPAHLTVRSVCNAMESIAPTGLAQEWDNVGLIAGNWDARVRRVLLCIDLNHAVVDEAVAQAADFVLAYHPPIFKPITSLRFPGTGTDALVFRCIQEGIAVYATHTALDAAKGGTNDVLAALCDVARSEPLEYVGRPGQDCCKIVIFVPSEHVEPVAQAVFAAGGGRIGDYSQCSFRLEGQGTFFGGVSSRPTIGKRGRIEHVKELRLEVIVPNDRLPYAVAAIRATHPYEEPALDIYPLNAEPVKGIGRYGELRRPISLLRLAKKLKRALHADSVQLVGPSDREITRAIIVAGAAGSLPFRVPLGGGDVIVTGEIRHHDALTIRRHDATAIALGHWASERPVLVPLAKSLSKCTTGLDVRLSAADQDPTTGV